MYGGSSEISGIPIHSGFTGGFESVIKRYIQIRHGPIILEMGYRQPGVHYTL